MMETILRGLRAPTTVFTLFTLIVGSCLPSMAAVEFACPVTKPAVLNFKPNGSFAGDAFNLFRDEKLFTVFPGNWQSTQRQEKGYRVPKIVWGSNVFNLTGETGRSTLTVTGRRLDAASGPLVFPSANTAWIDRGYFIASEFYLPALGCWEVTGHFHGADLKIVVDLK